MVPLAGPVHDRTEPVTEDNLNRPSPNVLGLWRCLTDQPHVTLDISR